MKRVLVVDDERPIRDLVADVLSAEGYTVDDDPLPLFRKSHTPAREKCRSLRRQRKVRFLSDRYTERECAAATWLGLHPQSATVPLDDLATN